MKKFSVLIFLSLILIFSGTTAMAETEGSFTLEIGSLEQARESSHALWSIRSAFPADGSSYYDQLDAVAQEIYDAVDLAMQGEPEEDHYLVRYVPEVDRSTFEADRWNYIYGALSAYYNDHPRETISMNGDLDVEYNYETVGGTKKMVYYLQLNLFDEHAEERLEKLDAAVEEFYAEFVADGVKEAEELEQYRYIHDYLCRLCRYNYDALAYSRPDEKFFSAHCAYGALVEETFGSGTRRGDVVCEGYADAFLLLCQRVGLECIYIVGEGTNYVDAAGDPYFTGESNHAWNAIKLDGGWYAVDVTWDDEGYTFKSGDNGFQTSVTVDFCGYDYFADNRYFTAMEQDEVAQDHKTYSQLCWLGIEFNLEAPELEQSYIAEARGWKSPYLKISLVDGAPFSDVNRLFGFSFGGYSLSEAQLVEICAAGDLVADRTLSVSGGKEYIFTGSGTETSVISRAESFAGSIFTVAPGSELSVEGVTIDGSGPSGADSLIAVTAPGGGKTAQLSLHDVTLTGNPGGAVDAGGTILVSGAVNITENKADLTVGSGGKVVVTGALTGSILLAGAEEVTFAVSAEGYKWTAQDRAVFGVDDHHLHVVYDETADALYLESWTFTNAAMPIRVGYLEADSLEELTEGSIRLWNTGSGERSVMVFAAVYSGSGQLLQVKALSTAAVTVAGGEAVSLQIPELRGEGVSYRIFTMDATTYQSLSEAAVWEFPAA